MLCVFSSKFASAKSSLKNYFHSVCSLGTVKITHKCTSEVTSTLVFTFLWVDANDSNKQSESGCCLCCYTTPMGADQLVRLPPGKRPQTAPQQQRDVFCQKVHTTKENHSVYPRHTDLTFRFTLVLLREFSSTCLEAASNPR